MCIIENVEVASLSKICLHGNIYFYRDLKSACWNVQEIKTFARCNSHQCYARKTQLLTLPVS